MIPTNGTFFRLVLWRKGVVELRRRSGQPQLTDAGLWMYLTV